ncbi:MAG: ABC transporter ATP-binding protein, partial [Acidimicrobiales bacterium]
TMHDCDTARHQHDHLMGWRRTLLEGADWATELLGELPTHLGAVEAARDALDERRAEQRAAQHDLERVLEQRMAASAAIDEADQELGEAAGSGMDESGLRRELEAAGRAVQDAREVHDAALSRLEELQIEATGLDVRREASAPPDSVAVPVPDATEVAAITAVQEALARLGSVLIDGEVDPDARALATAWTELTEDMQQVGGAEEGPSADERHDARRRVEVAAAALATLAAAKAASALTAEQRQALDAAHASVQAAEEQMARRRRSSGARRKLEAAQAAERALLEEHGFGGYLDVVLSGGRAVAADPNGPAIEREHFEATLALDALERAGHLTPELAHLRAERARLLGHITDLLGFDPGRDVLPLLHAHRPVSRALQAPLVAALANVDVHPVGESLEDAAVRYLAAHPLPEEVDPADAQADGQRKIERVAVDTRATALVGELAAAESEVDRSAEALQMAGRSVEAFESELSVRAGEDVTRMKRVAAVEQLRAQIDAVAATLRRAEEDARQRIAVAGGAVTAAENVFDQGSDGTSELARHARKLAQELPIDQRPEGDPLQALPLLAASLRAHSEVLQPEIDRASAAVASSSIELDEALAACRLAGTGNDGPEAEDLADGLQQLLGAHAGDGPLVLDEPLADLDHQTRDQLLEVIRTTATDRQLVLLTEDPEVLGWAIELPIDEGTAVPADALLARFHRANHGLMATTAAPPTPDAVDITHPDPAPVPTARRWAGQR